MNYFQIKEIPRSPKKTVLFYILGLKKSLKRTKCNKVGTKCKSFLLSINKLCTDIIKISKIKRNDILKSPLLKQERQFNINQILYYYEKRAKQVEFQKGTQVLL